nr:hypothetical protein [Pseudoclavibacter sp. Marseille-Q3772]
MQFFRTVDSPWFAKQDGLTKVGEGIYQNPKGEALIAFEFALEAGDDDQYPMEDVLDRYLVYVHQFDVAESTHENGTVHVFAGNPNDVERMRNELTGRRAYNVEKEDRIDLIVE